MSVLALPLHKVSEVKDQGGVLVVMHKHKWVNKRVDETAKVEIDGQIMWEYVFWRKECLWCYKTRGKVKKLRLWSNKGLDFLGGMK